MTTIQKPNTEADKVAHAKAIAKASHGAPTSLVTPEPVVETVEPVDFAKVLATMEVAIAKASSSFDAGLATFAKTVGKSAVQATAEFLSTPQGAEAYAKLESAKRPPMDRGTMVWTAEIDALTIACDAQVEAFAVAQNMDMTAARARLLVISPSFAKDYQRLSVACSQRSEAVWRAERETENTIVLLQAKRNAARDAELAVEKARANAKTPAEQALHDHVTKSAESRSVTFEKAMADGMRTDPTVQALYAVIEADRTQRRGN